MASSNVARSAAEARMQRMQNRAFGRAGDFQSGSEPLTSSAYRLPKTDQATPQGGKLGPGVAAKVVPRQPVYTGGARARPIPPGPAPLEGTRTKGSGLRRTGEQRA